MVNNYPILIASMGRVGSTLMTNVISKITNDVKFINLDNNIILKNGVLYKTHSFSNQMPLKTNCKVIYLFGNPMNIVISAHKYTNIKLHYKHMNADVRNINKWHIYDSLRLEDNFDSWYKKQNFDLITVRYETMYNNLSKIEEFINHKLEFPKYKKRRTNWLEHPHKELLQKTYGNLNKKILNAKDIKIW